MPRLFRIRARASSAVLMAGFAAFWLSSFALTCLAATDPPCGVPSTDCDTYEMMSVAAPCEQAVTSCTQRQVKVLITSSFDFSSAPAAIAILSRSVAVRDVGDLPPEDWRTARPLHTPLYLTYLSLLN